MMVDPPELTDQERRNVTLTALRQAAFDGQKTTLARIHYSHLAQAADEIERLAAELANANRLLEIGRRRSLEKSGGLEIDHSESSGLMTKEEQLTQQELCDALRHVHPSKSLSVMAANEIERLEKEIEELKDLMRGMEVPDR